MKSRIKTIFRINRTEEIYEAQMMALSPKGMRFLCKKALALNEIIKIDNSLFSTIAEINGSRKRGRNKRS